MADNKNKKGELDRSLINTGEKILNAILERQTKGSLQQLTGAVATGNKAADVENT